MNSLLRSLSVLIFSASILSGNSAKAQLIGTEAFLQSDYVEVGIATNGAFGTDANAPAGYHARDGAGGIKLGFVSDPAKDGWTAGTPNYIGDYFLPGSPQEGWDMELNGVWAQAWRGSGGTSFTGGLTGTVTTYSSTATEVVGIWEGTLGALKITATTKIRKGKLFFTTVVKIKNTGTSTLYNFYYDRTVDPDNEVAVPGGGDYTTDNKIDFKLPNSGNKTLVTGIGVSAIKAFLGLASKDCRARPYITISGLTPTDSLNKLHSGNGTVSAILKADSSRRQDCGIGIVFKIDSLRANDSTQLSYAYVLSAADVDSAFEELKPELNVGGKIRASGDTIKACDGTKVNIDIVGGDFYQWKWTPNDGSLSDSIGSRITITAGSVKKTYTATAISDLCPIDPITITIDPIANPDKPKVVTPIYYCQYDGPAPLTATASPGSVLQWYTGPSGGTPLTTLSPNTTAAGSIFYYVSQVTGALCESEREKIEVITRAIPVLSSFTFTQPTFCAAKNGTITFYSDSANMDYTLMFDKDGADGGTRTIKTDALRSFTLTGLDDGSYTNFVIINKYGCKSSPFFGPIIIESPRPQTPPITNNGPVCLNEEVQLKAPLVPGATYIWTGPDGFTSSLQNPTFISNENSGGAYTLRVKVDSCVYKPSVTVLVLAPTPKPQDFNSPYEVCEGLDFAVNLVRENAITYVWTGKDLTQTNQDLRLNPVALNQSGRYLLTATSENGCVTLDSLEVIVGKRPSFSIPADTSICSIDSANIGVISDGASISWTPESGLNSPLVFNAKARPSATTTYTAIVKSGNTCPDTSGQVTVTVIPSPMVKGYDTTVRMNIPYTLVPMFGQEVVKWKWTPSDSLSCSDCPNPKFNSNKAITYILTVSDKNGCSNAADYTINVFCDGENVTMPNAFTPNNDGSNDIYYVRGTGFTVKTFTIFNRLGQIVFSKENFAPNDPSYGWDGTFNGQAISDAAGFVYMLEVVCFNSKNAPLIMKGTVLMIK